MGLICAIDFLETFLINALAFAWASPSPSSGMGPQCSSKNALASSAETLPPWSASMEAKKFSSSSQSPSLFGQSSSSGFSPQYASTYPLASSAWISMLPSLSRYSKISLASYHDGHSPPHSAMKASFASSTVMFPSSSASIESNNASSSFHSSSFVGQSSHPASHAAFT